MMNDTSINNNNEESLKSLPFWNSDLDVEDRVEDLLSRLTLEEKIDLMAGRMIYWMSSIKRLGIPTFKTTDGPHGVGSGIFFLKKMTYFPVAICRTATWNLDLSKKFGEALAEETRAVGRHMILAPGINIQRTPLCGRNFEYQTEDPYLNSRTAVAVVKGIQSKRISCCVKHLAANNQEFNRFRVNSVVSERALHEIYYPAFKAAVEEADAWSFMACYNQLNGIYGCEHYELLRETLMKKWGFRGFVVSDWFATRFTRTGPCIKAGLSLEMPKAICYKEKKIKESLENGECTEDEFNDNVKRLLRVMFLTGLFDEEDKVPPGSRNTPEHQVIAKKIAEEGIVLLKNENKMLPIDTSIVKKIAITGPNAKEKMGWGGGSGSVRADYEITPYKGIKSHCKEKNIKTTRSVSKADLVILVVGLDHGKHMDRENKDRLLLELPTEQVELIHETLEENPNTVIVCVNGSPIGMNGWEDKAPAILEAWYAGAEAGNAIANILFGDVNPSGKLPITFPQTLADSPAHQSYETYPGLKSWDDIEEGDLEVLRSNRGMTIMADDRDKVYYKEGVFVGYRYFDHHTIEPLFPFGHGLSYTSFTYENLTISKPTIAANEKLEISMDLKNTGKRAGAEVVQLYIRDVESSVERPPKELKGFKKVFLEPNQKETLSFEINPQDLAYYSEEKSQWIVENGEFNVLIGSSSKDIRLEGSFQYTS